MPPADEQAAIVRYLAHANARIDKAIAAKRRLLALLTEGDTSTVTEALAGLDARGVPLKRALASMTAGAWGEAPEESVHPPRWCVRVADFDYPAGRVRLDTKTARALSDMDFAKRLLLSGDLLLEGSGGGEKTPVGRVVLFDHHVEALCSNFLQRMRARNGVDPEFLCVVLRNLHATGRVRPYINQTTGIQNLDLGQYLTTEIPMPSIDEQRRLVDSVALARSHTDAVRTRGEDEIVLLTVFRARLVADVVTGQVDVRGVASSLPEVDVEQSWDYPDALVDADPADFDVVIETSED